MKIGFLTADWGTLLDAEKRKVLFPGGSGWYRVHLPAMELAKNGHEVVIAEQVATSDDGLVLMDWETNEEHGDCDVIIMQRIMNDFGLALIDCAHQAGQKIVNDVDDWYWGLHPANNAYSATDPKTNPKCNRDIYKDILVASDLVTVSTPFLEHKISEWRDGVVLTRNAIDLERWNVSPQREEPIIGWVGATSHRSGDLETLKGVLGPFIERNDLSFHHGGWNPGFPHACELLDVDVNRSKSTPMCMINVYPQQFEFFDVGLVPLNKIDFNQAKSFIKGLEYAASGKPFVAQDTEEYKYLSREIGLGRTAKKGNNWTKHLTELLDYDLRVEEAERNRKLVEQFDIADRWLDWEKAYSSIL